MGGKRVDLTGKRFGRLLVVGKYDPEADGELPIYRNLRGQIWTCFCDCGETTFCTTWPLRNGTKQSCGCLRAEMASERMTAIQRILHEK